MNRLVIILLGPPGAGKGTLAWLLSERLNLFYLETSKILEASFARAKKGEFVEAEGQKYDLEEEKKRWEQGLLNSRPLVNFLVKNKIEEIFQRGESLVLAGSPREVEEAATLMPFLERRYGKENIKIVLLELGVEDSIFRNSHRRICELMRHPILWNEETRNLSTCPLDGSKLIRRALDKPEIIKKRFKVYQDLTLPVVGYLEKQNFAVKRANAAQAVADEFNDVLKVLE